MDGTGGGESLKNGHNHVDVEFGLSSSLACIGAPPTHKAGVKAWIKKQGFDGWHILLY